MPCPREKREAAEALLIGPHGLLSTQSTGRPTPEPPCEMRTCFQRDVDRITHSKSFRRLKHKTQVFLRPEGDHYRTRRTHTLEVARRARTIARELAPFLAQQTERRNQRAQLIAERLEKAQIPGALEGAQRLAQGGAVTRGHFARFLVECGKASSMADVFKKYLARGKTGYVPPQWCTIEQAIDVIHHSGGKAVLAHPGRYNLSAKWLKRLVAHFAEHHGDAMEVAQCQQSPNERTQLATLARQHHLWASQGSDFHQPCPWIELGRKLWLPAGVEGVWQLWEQPQNTTEREL